VQLQVQLLHEAFLERFHLLVQQVQELNFLVLLQLVSATIALADLDPVAEQAVVIEVEAVHGTAPREGGLLGGVALVEHHGVFTVGPGKVAAVGLADVFHDVLLGAQEHLAALHELLEKGALRGDLVHGNVAQVLVQGNLGQLLQITG